MKTLKPQSIISVTQTTLRNYTEAK